MKKLFMLIVVFVFLSPFCVFSQDRGRVSHNAFFFAEVLSVNKTKSGKIFVTVEFTGKVSGQGFRGSVANVKITRGIGDCGKSATLVDSDGNEYFTNRCLPRRILGGFADDGGRSANTELLLNEKSKAQFVFEFTTPLTNANQDSQLYSLIVPVSFSAHDHRGPNTWDEGLTTLSFFDISAK